MTISPLEQFLITQLFAYMMVFARVGAALMVMPVYGEKTVYARGRLIFALALAVVLQPVLMPLMPKIPNSPFAVFVLLIAEVLVGSAIGLVGRFLIAVTHVAGMVISVQSSLALASQFDPTQGTQGSVVGNYLSLIALVFLLSTDMHHVMLRGLTDSYSMFAPGTFPPMDDMAHYFAMLTSSIFLTGLKLSAPIVVIGLVVYVGGGVLTRLMPNLQIFFIMMPAQILLTFFLLLAVLGAMLSSFNGYYANIYSDFLKMDGYTGF